MSRQGDEISKKSLIPTSSHLNSKISMIENTTYFDFSIFKNNKDNNACNENDIYLIVSSIS